MALKAPEYLSPSSITTFEQCPLKFKYTRIDGIREPPTDATLLGNFVHDILEKMYLADPGSRSTNLAREVARDLWDNQYRDQVSKVVAEKKLNDFRWRAWFCVENLFQLESPETRNFDGVEFELNTSLDGILVRGFVDRYHLDNGKIVIGDYKTGKVPNAFFVKDKFFQLMTYAALFRASGVGETKRLELIFLKGPQVFTREVTDWELEETVQRIKNVSEGIKIRCESESFETNKTRLCDWCYFKSKCPAWSKK